MQGRSQRVFAGQYSEVILERGLEVPDSGVQVVTGAEHSGLGVFYGHVLGSLVETQA